MRYVTARQNQRKTTGLHWQAVPSETLTETLKLFSSFSSVMDGLFISPGFYRTAVLASCTIYLLTFKKSKGMLTREWSHFCPRNPEVSQGSSAQHGEGGDVAEYRSASLVEELGGIT